MDSLIGQRLTPAMHQFAATKKEYPDCLIMFRMGDFYEMFFEDAKTAAKELEITLTSRGKGDARAPLAGIPFHALEPYLAKLVKKGYKVAICEQLEDPKLAKGIVKRGVTRVVTPGTMIDSLMLEPNSNNYLMSIYPRLDNYGIALVDLSTGEFLVTEADNLQKLLNEITRFAPAEILIPESLKVNEEFTASLKGFINPYNDHYYTKSIAYNNLLNHFKVSSLHGYGIENKELAINAAGALLNYLKDTQKTQLSYINKLKSYAFTEHMVLDSSTMRNLELLTNIKENSPRGSLFSIMNRTKTPMGTRLLKRFMLQPLLDKNNINERLNCVEELVNDSMLRAELTDILKEITDIERTISRVMYGNANARDLIGLCNSLRHIPKMKELLKNSNAKLNQKMKNIPSQEETVELINGAIKEEPALTLREGNLIKEGYSQELDELRKIAFNIKDWLVELENKERARTGIKSLKVSYNRVFGYFINISNSNKDQVPPDYIRKQTLVNGERYITPELKEKEDIILNAEERMNAMEYNLFQDIIKKISNYYEEIQKTASAIAEIDVYSSFADMAVMNNYIRPKINDKNTIELKECRHPVIETLTQQFIPNDFKINESNRLQIITGPNMSGKCVVGETLIFTKKGIFPIEKFKSNTIKIKEFDDLNLKLVGELGLEKTSHFYYDGKRPTIKITTQFGYSIEGTDNHPIKIRCSNGKEAWKLLKDITKKDYLILKRDINVWGTETRIRKELIESVNKYQYNNNVIEYKLPKKISPDLAYVIGLLIGDGTLTYKTGITLSNIDKEIIDEFYRIIDECFGYRVRTKKNKADHIVSSVRIRKFFEGIGLGYLDSLTKEIPDCILHAPKEIVCEFLKGLFDTDGEIAKKYGNPSLSTSSIKLAKQVQLVLLNFGIISSLRPKKTKRNINYRISIYGENAILFHQKIGFRLSRKMLRSGLASNLRMPNYGIPYMDRLLKEIQKRIVQTANKKVALKKNKKINSIFYTYLPKKSNISHFKLKELIEYCRLNGINCAELDEIHSNNYFYDFIEHIEYSKEPKEVYDFTIPKTHSFIANGFINHNSTCMRQVALVQLMAQIGSFVPCSFADLCIVDRIFTRVGAYDDLTMGQSTFMVEMTETANILNNATNQSLIILDEIGRGTSTFDGISIAWAVAEYINSNIKAKTLFATHYHQLNMLANKFPGIKNYNIAVNETEDDIVFLRKLVEGGTDKSYGIQVAKLAGVPNEIISRSKEIMAKLEEDDRIAEKVSAEDVEKKELKKGLNNWL